MDEFVNLLYNYSCLMRLVYGFKELMRLYVY